MIADYKEVETITQQRGGVILTKAILQDKLSTGLVDLVANKPAAHTAQLLNGKIQSLDMRLIHRYKDFYMDGSVLKFEIRHENFDIGDNGLYEILLEFNKKV